MAITPGEGVTVVEVAEVATPTHRVLAVKLDNTQSSGVVMSRRCRFMGAVGYNSAGTGIGVRLYNGPGNQGQEIFATGLPGGNLPPFWCGDRGVDCDGGISWTGALTATTDFVVWVRVEVTS